MTNRAIIAKLHGRTAAGVPRRAVWAAYATTVTTLPSCIWRIAAMTFHIPLLQPTTAPPPGHGPILFTGPWYLITLSVVSEALAFLTVGLVSEWGEAMPRWVPGLAGGTGTLGRVVVPAPA